MRAFLIFGVGLTVTSLAACGSDEKGGNGNLSDASSTGGSVATGGASSGGSGTGGAGTGGSGTGGSLVDASADATPDAAPSCAPLQACCSGLTGPFADVCNTFASMSTPTSCAAAEGVFCGGNGPATPDGGGRPPSDGGDAGDAGDAGGGGCATLATCCAVLSGGDRARCNAIVNDGVGAGCDLLIPFLCP